MSGWIEALFGLSPDGGSGATEALLAAAVALALVAAVSRVRARRRAGAARYRPRSSR